MEVKPITLQESEFLAENTLIEIIPNFVSGNLQFISVKLQIILGFFWTFQTREARHSTIMVGFVSS